MVVRRHRKLAARAEENKKARRRTFLVMTMSSLLLASTAQAQNVGAGSTTVPAAAKERVVQFTIPPQALDSALTRLADEGGIHLLFASKDVAGLRSSGLSGRYTVAQALTQVLAGSGMAWHFTEANTVVLEKPASSASAGSGPMALPPVRVEGQNGNPQRPDGPGVGYVATESLTGTKTDTPILETPQSISVVTPRQIEDQNVQNVAQAIRYMAGVTPAPSQFQDSFDTFYARGFISYGDDMYLDGLRQLNGEFADVRVEPYFLERIEVLKGPASVLYGQGFPGATINLVSKRPPTEPFHEIGIQYGSYNWHEAMFDLGGPLDADGQFLYRLTGLARDTDTQVNFSEKERFSLAPALTWRPSGDTTLTILTNFQRDPKATPPDTLPAIGTVLPNPNGRIPTNFYGSDPSFTHFDRSQIALGYLFEHHFDDVWTVRQNFRYADLWQSQRFLYTDTFEDDLRTLDRYSYVDDERVTGITLDNQIEAKFATGPVGHTALVGVDYQHNHVDQKAAPAVDVAPPIDAFNPVYNQTIPAPAISYSDDGKYWQTGLYFQDQLKLDRWRLLLGGRQDWAGASDHDRIAEVVTNQDDQAFTGRVGLVYLFDSGLAPYASYATSFRPQSGTDFAGALFKPTTGEQYEVGLKYQPPGVNAFVTLAGYQLTEENELVSDPDHVGFSKQLGETRSRGVEVEGHASLAEGLNLITAYTYTDAIVTKSTDTDTAISGDTLPIQGKHIAAVPRHAASLWGDYTIQTGALRGLGFGGGVRYVGWSFGDDVNSYRVPSYTVFDAVVHYELAELSPGLKGWYAAVNATNLFDKTYVSSCDSASTCGYGDRRNVIASLRYRW
ncbi:MAG TPA: TonB-dependent siderophore receptor [Stellaceae bacterium]|nr:TonB-dependent siderophore receptor [Stellaceae bacterium]